MARPDKGGEWRLGLDLSREPAAVPVNVHAEDDLSHARLTHPIQVVTVEHLGWALIAVWALLTRLLLLGARPLASSEAVHALFEYDLANRTREAAAAGYHPVWAGWAHVIEAGIFAAGGAGDYGARVLFAIGGLLTVAMTFEMRHYIGRAGAIALGMAIALSPTIAYFSRASSTVMLSSACAVVTIAVFMANVFRPAVQRAAGLGVVAGLMIAADPSGLVTAAIFLIALMMIGLWQLFVIDHVYLRTRVWLDRYASLAATAILVAGIVWVLSELALFRGMPIIGIKQSVESLWSGANASNYLRGLSFYAPGLALYEFMIMIGGIAGAILIAVARVRSRFAVFCLLWMVMSFAYYLWTPEQSADRIIWMVVPTAFVGAIAVDYTHHAHAWRVIRFAIAGLAAITVYVQVLSIFVHYGPDVSEASWARHGNLYWGDAGTIQAEQQLSDIRKRLAPGEATAYVDGIWPPTLRWGLRTLRPAISADSAAVLVDLNPPQPTRDLPNIYQFDFEQSWHPSIDTLDFVTAVQFVFTARIWSPVKLSRVNVSVRSPTSSAPTLILPPDVPR